MSRPPKDKLTPMMQQWTAAKEQQPDAVLFFRMGDFYELFGDDAVEASRVLELTLTSRDKGKDNAMPMAGVPHHALQGYLGRLLTAGYKVAVCDQLEDPRTAKGIVKRGITRVVTPGTVLDDVALEPTRNNYLMALWPGLAGYGIAYADISTGELRGTLAPDLSTALAEIGRVEAREALVPPNLEAAVLSAIKARSRRGSLPSSPINFARRPTATKVPAVSNKSTNRKAKMTEISATSIAPFTSICKNVGEGSGGIAAMPLNVASPDIQPRTETIRIDRISAPGTFRTLSTTARKNPKAANKTVGWVSLPTSTKVAG